MIIISLRSTVGTFKLIHCRMLQVPNGLRCALCVVRCACRSAIQNAWNQMIYDEIDLAKNMLCIGASASIINLFARARLDRLDFSLSFLLFVAMCMFCSRNWMHTMNTETNRDTKRITFIFPWILQIQNAKTQKTNRMQKPTRADEKRRSNGLGRTTKMRKKIQKAAFLGKFVVCDGVC